MSSSGQLRSLKLTPSCQNRSPLQGERETTNQFLQALIYKPRGCPQSGYKTLRTLGQRAPPLNPMAQKCAQRLLLQQGDAKARGGCLSLSPSAQIPTWGSCRMAGSLLRSLSIPTRASKHHQAGKAFSSDSDPSNRLHMLGTQIEAALDTLQV